MFNLQGSEIIFILLLALVVLGPEKLPSTIRRFMQTYAELRKMGTGFQAELKSALDEPMREVRETADLIRAATDPSALIDQAESDAPEVVASERAAERELVDSHDENSDESGGDADSVDDSEEHDSGEDADAVVEVTELASTDADSEDADAETTDQRPDQRSA